MELAHVVCRAWILLNAVIVTAVTGSRCAFPKEWRGLWYQNGLGEISIGIHAVSHKGVCMSSDGKKYLLRDKDNQCFVCLVFTPQHDNLLQYKESYCVNDDNLSTVCNAITGDFPLHTIVKVSGQPVPCPFQGPYFFSYTNDSAEECRDPLSEIHACADPSRFVFGYRQCKHLTYTQDVQLNFQCMATWFNGEQFLYGRFMRPGRANKDRMYRCFMYSLYGSRGDMSMSQDATCQGLSSPRFGMNILSLQHRVDEWPRPSCQFPEKLRRPGGWRDVMGQWRMSVETSGEEFALHDLMHPDFLVPGEVVPETRLRARCVEIVDNFVTEPTAGGERLGHYHILTFATNDSCVSSYRCVRLKQRADQVFEIRIGAATDDTYLACQDDFFAGSTKHVFFPHETPGSNCPLSGSYTYTQKQGDCSGTLNIGCQTGNQFGLHVTCRMRQQKVEYLQCAQTWTEGEQLYIIVTNPITGFTPADYKPGDCLVIRSTTEGFTMTADSDCGGGNIKIMNQPMDFIVKTPKKTCERTEMPSSNHPPRLSDTSRHNYRSDVTSTSRPHVATTARKPSAYFPTDKVMIINNSNTRTCANCIIFLSALLTVILNER